MGKVNEEQLKLEDKDMSGELIDNNGPNYFDLDTATREMFTEGVEPYIYIDRYIEDHGELKGHQELGKMAAFAEKRFGIKNVKTLYQKFKKDIDNDVRRYAAPLMQTLFTGQPLMLNTTWECNDKGVRKGADLACSHPIMISKLFRNTKTKKYKIELAFRIRGHRWETISVERKDIATNREIVKLANYGISVTSANADNLIRYLQELEQRNPDIPLIETAPNLGWLSEDVFVPYSNKATFDGEKEFEQLFNSVKEVGDREEWLNEMRLLRQKNPIISMVLAGTLASPLLKWISALPGFVHIWSGISGSGKTVLAMVAASCFGNPEAGHYMQSFNSTVMAQEKNAGVLNNCPLVIDESQLNTSKYNVYFLAAGQGKARGRTDGSVAAVESWCNTIISTGEKPLVTRSDGQGAHARVIEVELKDILFDFEEGNRLANFLRENYGHAGPMMVKAIQSVGKESLREKHLNYARELKRTKDDLQEKQVMFGAAILLAEELATEYVFLDDASPVGLNADFVASCLKTDTDSSVSQRAYDETVDWIAANQSKFTGTNSYEVFGEIEDDHVYIIRTQFNKFMDENNYSDRAVLSEWSKDELIETYFEKSTGKTRYDAHRRIGKQKPRCVCLNIVQNGEDVPTNHSFPIKDTRI